MDMFWIQTMYAKHVQVLTQNNVVTPNIELKCQHVMMDFIKIH